MCLGIKTVITLDGVGGVVIRRKHEEDFQGSSYRNM